MIKIGTSILKEVLNYKSTISSILKIGIYILEC